MCSVIVRDVLVDLFSTLCYSGVRISYWRDKKWKNLNLNKPIFHVMLEVAAQVAKNLCPFCGATIREEDFRDGESKREYSVSGLCQTCQDDVFGR